MNTRISPRRGRPVDAGLRSRKTQLILDAARSCFARHGFHAATTASIAAEAKISAGSLYQYFSSKDDLIVAMVEENLRKDLNLVAKIAGAENFWAGLYEVMSIFVVDEFHPDKMHLWLEINAEATRNDVVRDVVQQYARSLSSALSRVIESAQIRGEVRSDVSASHCATLLTSLFEGVFVHAATASSPRTDMVMALPDLLRTLLAPQ
jgi:TetR/AcrR family transcriptional repressor of uid operon